MKTNLKFQYDCFLWDGKNRDEARSFLIQFEFNFRLEGTRRGVLSIEWDNGRYWETAARIKPGFWVCISHDRRLTILSPEEFQERRVG